MKTKILRIDDARAKIDRLMTELPYPQKDIALALRSMLLRADLRLTEELKWGAPCYTCGGNVCSIVPSKSDVRLTFHRGQELNAEGVTLENDDRSSSYTRLRSVDDVRSPALLELVRQAVALNVGAPA